MPSSNNDSSNASRGSTNGNRFGAGGYRNNLSPVRVSDRRVVNKLNSVRTLAIPGTVARNEMDSHADTCCAGANWTLLTDSGFTCDVYAYNDNSAATKNIPIGTCATVITTDDGYDVLLIAHEMLYFGNQLSRSLINPNQLRFNDVTVQDDYTRYEEPFGITTFEHLFIPFIMDGTTVYFESRVPTSDEIDSLAHVELTRDDPWDPKRVQLRISSVQFAGATSNGRGLQSVPTILHETDTVFASFEPLLNEQLANLRIINSVNVLPRDDWRRGRQASAVLSDARHTTVTAENLSKAWNIGLDTAAKTLQVTTQQGVRTALHPIQRRYRVDHLQLHRNRLNTTFYVDQLFAKTKSLRGNSCATVFTNGKFTAVYPAETRKHAGQALADFAQDVGIPEHLTADLAGELSGKHTEFMQHVRHLRIQIHWAEKGHHKQNHRVEREIGILKARWRRRMVTKSIPTRLWDYGLVYESEILSRTSRGNDGRTGYEELTGKTPDISEWLDFQFYDLVWYQNDEKPSINDESSKLGRWLGVSHRVGSDLCYWILTKAGQVLSCTTVQHVTDLDQSTTTMSERINAFNNAVNDRLSDIGYVDNSIGDGTPYIEDIMLDDGGIGNDHRTGIIPTDEEYGSMLVTEKSDADDFESYDKYIGSQILLDLGHQRLQGRVVKRTKGPGGETIGRAHSNPMFDTRAYVVQFNDGSVGEYTANVVAENVYAQIDSEGNEYALMKEIVDHRHNNLAVPVSDGYKYLPNGNTVPKQTTRGWQLNVEWKDGSSSWVNLKDLKDSNPIETAEYAIANKIDHEPAFNWWVRNVLHMRQRIINKVQNKYWRTTHKYGIQLPHSADEAFRIDTKMNNRLWATAIDKELSKVKVAWEVRDDLNVEDCRTGKQLIGYTEIKCHMIFDVKMDFTRKARFVAGGHMTEAPATITYSSVVTRDSVRIAFLLAGLNNLSIMACDISNAYLNAPCREKIWFIGGSEGGGDCGKVLVLTRALYGLKSSGASWRLMLSQSMLDMKYTPTRADPDVYRRLTRRDNGTEYYEILLVYVDDILVVSHNPEATMTQIGKLYEIKPGSAGPPSTYLGAQVYVHSLPDGTAAWAMTSEKYVTNAVKTVEDLLAEDNDTYQLRSNPQVPFPYTYKPELDFSTELDPNMLSRYRQLIGILRWAVELGRVDIYLEVSLLSQYLASPRQGHLEAVYSIFAYLKKHDKSAIVFDPKDVILDESAFSTATQAEWKEFYGDVAEEIPSDMPEPKGNSVDITCFVDADHAGNVVTRRSHTGILIFVQNAPIIWHSKRQNTVEASSFGSEFVALRAARDMIVALRYKLRMFGVPLRGPASTLCDNQGVVKNTTLPASTLTKRHNAINYHAVREAAAAGILRVGKEDGQSNLADVFTKVLPKKRRYELFGQITYRPTIHDAKTDSNGSDVQFVS